MNGEVDPKLIPYPYRDLVERRGVKYEVNSKVGFNGLRRLYRDCGFTEILDGLCEKGDSFLSRVEPYINGKLHGVKKLYHGDDLEGDSYGQALEYTGYYKEGIREGTHKWFFETGRLFREGNYKDGKKEGLWKYGCEKGKINDDGQIIVYAPHCTDPYSGHFIDEKEEGLWTYYHGNGQLKMEGNYKDGKQDGLWTSYDHNGELRMEENYKDGKQDGMWTYYHGNGQLEKEENWKDGKEVGLWRQYHPNGQLQSEGNYKEGKQVGIERLWRYYNPNGQLESVSRVWWKDGKEVVWVTNYYPNGEIRSRSRFD